MTDPVTIGAMAASALAMAAPEVVKSAVGEVVKDAYKKLKDKVSVWAGGEVVALEVAARETKPNQGKQLAVAEIVNEQSPDDRNAVQALAKALMDALEECARIQPIGVDVGHIHAWRVRFGTIEVTQGTGLHAQEIVSPGEVSFDHIKVGK